MTSYVAYYRVSTQKQGAQGLGMEAQRDAVRKFIRPGDPANPGDAIVASFTEVESGGRNDRPQLAAALEMCRRTKSTLLIAKLDRLARNVAFIANLMECGTKFIACDMPDADAFRLHVEAAFAEEERRRISKRIVEALAQAKKRGIKLGGYKGEASLAGLKRTHASRQANRNEFIAQLAPVVIPMLPMTARKLAQALNEKGITAQGGGKWFTESAKRLMKHLEGVKQ